MSKLSSCCFCHVLSRRLLVPCHGTVSSFPTLWGFAVVLHKQEECHGPATREVCKSPGAGGCTSFSVPWRAGLGVVAVVTCSSLLCCFLSPSSFGGMLHLSLFCPLSLWQAGLCVISRQLSDPDLCCPSRSGRWGPSHPEVLSYPNF